MSTESIGLTLGVKVSKCDECDKFNKAIEIYNLFDWPNSVGLIDFDKEKGEILLAEEQIIRIIQMVNPLQMPRRIRLVSQDELLKQVRG